MKTAIITGQDGCCLAQLLLKKDYRVIGVTRGYIKNNIYNFNYLNIADRLLLEETDLLDFSSIIKILIKYTPNEFYNLGAQSSVWVSFEQPISTLNYNTQSLLNIWKVLGC